MAERNAKALPCEPQRRELLTIVRAEISKILRIYPDGRMAIEKSRAEHGQPCPNDSPAVVDRTNLQGGENSSTSNYVGDYTSDVGTVVVRQTPEGFLQVTVGKSSPVTIVSIGDNIFTIRASPGYYLVFQRNETGDVTHILFLQPNGTFSAFRN